MKTLLNIKSVVFLLVLLSCNETAKRSTDNTDKRIVLYASQKFSNFDKIDRIFKIYHDSSYLFSESIKDINGTKTKNWKGKAQIIDDTIKFFPFRLGYNGSKTAVLKNGFIEFCDIKYSDRMKIQNTSLMVKHLIDFKNFQDYAVFTFYNKSNELPSQQSFSNHDLTTKELTRIDYILRRVFQQNNELRKFSEYIIQIESVKNAKGDSLAFIECFCKDNDLKEIFQYRKTSMKDGGNCNLFIQLNLTIGKVEILNIAGSA